MLDRPGSIFKWWLHNEVYYLRTRGFIDKFQFVEHMKLSVCRIDGVKECKDGNRCFHLFKNKKV